MTARNHLFDAPHMVIFPSIALVMTVLSFNFLGDALRDWLDPKSAITGRKCKWRNSDRSCLYRRVLYLALSQLADNVACSTSFGSEQRSSTAAAKSIWLFRI